MAEPDHYYGSPFQQANANVRKTLSTHIVPSSSTDLPIAPNFFIHRGEGADSKVRNCSTAGLPNGPKTRLESHTFEVGSWTMTTDKDSYVPLRGLTALKNAEEWTKEVREAAIEGANEMDPEFQTVENEEEEGTDDEEQETW
ncbi:hypothetical protein V8E54_001694 [Elaphomyces granulatus]